MPKQSKSMLLNHFWKMESENEIALEIDFRNDKELVSEVLKLERKTVNQLRKLSLVAPRKKTIDSIILYATANDSFPKK
jgi:hypothetical protein